VKKLNKCEKFSIPFNQFPKQLVKPVFASILQWLHSVIFLRPNSSRGPHSYGFGRFYVKGAEGDEKSEGGLV
jgi:hypothetical protein